MLNHQQILKYTSPYPNNPILNCASTARSLSLGSEEALVRVSASKNALQVNVSLSAMNISLTLDISRSLFFTHREDAASLLSIVGLVAIVDLVRDESNDTILQRLELVAQLVPVPS